MIVVLLKSMPRLYDSLMTTLKHLLDPTLDNIISALLDQERSIKEKNGDIVLTS